MILWKSGVKVTCIKEQFKQEGVIVSTSGWYKLFSKYAKTGKVGDETRGCVKELLNSNHYTFIDQCMQ